MTDISADQYAIVKTALLHSKSYVDESNINPQQKQDWQERFDLAMQALQEVNKKLKAGNGNVAVEGGSANRLVIDSVSMLMDMFGIDKRIGR